MHLIDWIFKNRSPPPKKNREKIIDKQFHFLEHGNIPTNNQAASTRLRQTRLKLINRSCADLRNDLNQLAQQVLLPVSSRDFLPCLTFALMACATNTSGICFFLRGLPGNKINRFSFPREFVSLDIIHGSRIKQ